MTEHRLPPSPVGSANLYRWALDLVEYLTRNTERQGSVQPTPIMLAHQVTGQLNRAIAPADRRRNSNGTMMYSVAATAPVYALNGAWQQVGTMTFRGRSCPGKRTSGATWSCRARIWPWRTKRRAWTRRPSMLRQTGILWHIWCQLLISRLCMP